MLTLWLSLALAKEPAPPATAPLGAVSYLNQQLSLAGDARALGGLVPAGEGPWDDRQVTHPACHAFYDWEPGAQRSTPEGVLTWAPQAAAERLKQPMTGPGAVWVGLTEPEVRVARVRDVLGLQACCAQSPDACEGAYVSEVWSGKARLWLATGEDDAPGWVKGAKAKNALVWRMAGQPFGGDDCGLWRESPPLAASGRFVLGVSNAVFSEENARRDALAMARREGMSWGREKGLGDLPWTQRVEARWCIESFPGGGGDQYLAHVLVYLPGP